MTDALRDEGTARDLIRQIQEARKKQDLVVTDRIALYVHSTPKIEAAIRAHEAMIAGEVLAVSMTFGPLPVDVVNHEAKLEGEAVQVGLRVVR